MPRKSYTRYRSAITGRYVSKEHADAHPDTTVSITVEPKEQS